MNATPSPTDPRVTAYLEALAGSLYGLSEPSRSEVYDEIRQHIADEVAQRGEDPTAVPEILDRLGDPADIAHEAGAGGIPPGGYVPGAVYGVGGFPPSVPRRSRVHEILAVIFLAVGGFVFIIGWIVGVVLLWTSDRFTKADKAIGTLLVPGGFALSFLVALLGVAVPVGAQTCHELDRGSTTGAVTVVKRTCTGGMSLDSRIIVIAVLAVLVLGPAYTAIRLSRRVARM